MLVSGKYTLLIPIPEEIALLIGRVLFQWGAFEVRMNACIEQMLADISEPPEENWSGRSFKKRKAYLKHVAALYLEDCDASYLADIKGACGVAADLHWRRNLVAHGQYYMKAVAGNAEYWAWSNYRGQLREIALTEPILKKLWGDLAHFGGEFGRIMYDLGAQFHDQELILDDTAILQGPEGGSWSSLPTIQSTRPPPLLAPR